MEEKRAVDGLGAVALTGFAALLAFNQVVIKVTGSGFNPLFQAGLRSLLGFGVILAWMHFRKTRPMTQVPGATKWGLVAGLLFAQEFICLYAALDIGSVSRVSILFYSMPVWLAIIAHFILPGERLTPIRSVGLILAMAGVALALLDRDSQNASLLADGLSLLAAFGWAGIALCLRLTPLAKVPPETQLYHQLLFSAPVMLVLSPLFGPLIRDLQPIHFAGLAFQVLAVASFGYLAWFVLIKIYRASSVASFSFLSPVLAVIMGWAILGEQIGVQVWGALALVAAGVVLINRK
ncbi:MAG: EamA family transporter [Rhodobacteraceae bacterium]|nr:EamA family transporter [Paracoccaceae bacterium]